MKKILTVLVILSISAWFTPYAQAGISQSTAFKLSVTIPESAGQKQINPQEIFSSNTSSTSNTTDSQVVSPKAYSQGFQLVETIRNNEPVILITYVVE